MLKLIPRISPGITQIFKKKWRAVVQDELKIMVDKNLLTTIESSKESLITRPLGMK